ncbi:MAG: ABC transporter ATP-binding protein [Woeseia sp.]|nr:ABC transporter ATP-binding protein [Woeseia sp.]
MLTVSSMSSGYGSARILQNLSFEVKNQEILAIIGRNGVGKTTLMKTLIGGLRLSEGQIEYKGKSIGRLRPSHRAKLGIAYVPQGRGIFARMTVAENLLLGKGLGGYHRNPDYDRAYKFFPFLKQRSSQRAGSLSGGEQQQLAIGRVLIGSPELILLDEPSEGVQPNIVQEIGDNIRLLAKQEGLTVIIVEQNLELINSVADRCIVMDKGTIVAHLTSNEIRDPMVAKKYLAI